MAKKQISDKKPGNRRKQAPAVAAVSLGCSKNLVDTEVMLGALATAGYAIASEPADADIIIVNTCGFISAAVDESKSVISEMAALKSSGEAGLLVVAGCLAERERSALFDEFPEIDLIVGTSSYPEIVELLETECSESFSPQNFLHDHRHPRLLATPPWTAYLKIAEGCSNRCSYCAIPSLRGAYRSRTPDSLLQEAASLAAIGVRELILVAQDTTRYGTDLKIRNALPALLNRLSDIDGIHWIRLMYAYPERVNKQLAEAIAGIPKVCSYLDIPIQHIDDKILTAMNRRGGSDAVRRAVALLKENVPGICLRTTVLVGFPGETDSQFNRLLRFMEETEFDRLGAFAYSPEPGTPASVLPRQISESVKNERVKAIMELQSEISLKKNRELVGRELEIIVECEKISIAREVGISKRKKTYGAGRSYRDAPEIDGLIYFTGVAAAGDFARVIIQDAEEYDLYGKIIK
ncbi:MAG: 30S ribosomal protein S12 methylthiotransferase RimO [bacterium]